MSYDSVRGQLTQAWEALSPGQQWVHSDQLVISYLLCSVHLCRMSRHSISHLLPELNRISCKTKP